MAGEIAKLTIKGFETEDELAQQNNPVAEFTAMFNPENFDVGNLFNFENFAADSEIGKELKFKNIGERMLNYAFLIDGTSASGTAMDVDEQIEAFKKATGFEGKKRRPLFLAICWGTFTIRCVLEKMDIKYTLFRSDGKPVRGVIEAKFKEYKTPIQQLLENPDIVGKLTRLVNSSLDNPLDLLAHKVYGASDKLIELARANGLNSLKSIAEGQRLELPPVDQLLSQAEEELGNQLSSLQSEAEGAIQQGLSNLF